MNTDLLNYGHAPKSDQTVTDIYGDEWHPNLVTTPSSSQPHSIISSGSNAFSQCNHVANIQYQMAAHSPISMCSRAPTPSWTGSPFTTQPVYDLDASHQFDVPWPVREPDDHRPLLSRLENAVEPATPKSISPRGAVWEYVESEADGVFPLFAQDSSKFEVDQFTKTIPTLNSEDAHLGSISVEVRPKDQFSDILSQTTLGVQVPATTLRLDLVHLGQVLSHLEGTCRLVVINWQVLALTAAHIPAHFTDVRSYSRRRFCLRSISEKPIGRHEIWDHHVLITSAWRPPFSIHKPGHTDAVESTPAPASLAIPRSPGLTT